jgi:peptidoglycan/LPS O-acetylase OafA/YrhL
MSKKYFKSLNGLRFIGAFVVLLCHVEFIKFLNNVPSMQVLPFYNSTGGHMGVILFFVLSGFLITYLLLEELKHKSRIHLGKFYVRRMLRIWPLYFLMVLISIFLIPQVLNLLNSTDLSFGWGDVKYYIYFLPNIAKATGHFMEGGSHLWSIGVEEQFYLIWPILIVLFRKRILLLLLLVIFGITVLPFFISYLSVHTELFVGNEMGLKSLESFVSHFKIGSMAIGGVFAFHYQSNKTWFNFLYYKYVEIGVFFLTFYLWFSGVHFPMFTDEIYSILFAIIIFIISTKDNPLIHLEFKLLNFLGDISYGIYVYHWVVILITLLMLKNFIPDFESHLGWFNFLLYFISILFTIFISYLSYNYFEKPFLRLKDKFNP